MIFLRQSALFFTLVFYYLYTASSVAAQGLVPCSGADCDFNALRTLIENIINFLFIVAAPVAALLFAYAGFLYVTDAGSGKNLSKAKSIFTTAFWGLVFMASAWLVVKLIVSTLGNPGGPGGQFLGN
jgi:hypothetical protein